MDFILRAIKKKDISLKVEYTGKLKNINPQNGVLYIEKLDHLDYKEEKIGEGTKGISLEMSLTIVLKTLQNTKVSFI